MLALVGKLLLGRRTLGRGTFSAVFEGTTAESVLKLTMGPEQYAYMTDGQAPQGVYKPRLYADHGIVGNTSQAKPCTSSKLSKSAAHPPTTAPCRAWSCFTAKLNQLTAPGGRHVRKDVAHALQHRHGQALALVFNCQDDVVR